MSSPKVETVKIKRSSFKRNHQENNTLPPKVETAKNQFFPRQPHPPKVETFKKKFFQNSYNLKKPKVETVKNQFFQDNHTLPK